MSEGGASTDSVREASETVGEAMATSGLRRDGDGAGGRKGFGVAEREGGEW